MSNEQLVQISTPSTLRRTLPLGITHRDLLKLNQPAQYLGGEHNAVYKDPQLVDVNIALAFPDTYEVGMSHLGMQILYDIINSDQRAWAQRCYTPLPDMEQLLREKGAKLFSLEGRQPLASFDCIGFSLQYELCGTNILQMLDLAGLDFYAVKRPDSAPLVIGGGPYSYHPEALAPFFDVFFLGDAEEFIPELLQAVREVKRQGPFSRAKLMSLLKNSAGVYLPSQFEPVYNSCGALLAVRPLDEQRPTVERRLLPTLDGAPFPKRFVVPNVRTVHNRLSVEVMRGCVRGCRFCQAGYLYRPQRERSPAEIQKIIEEALPNTGFEEVSLLSLSTADYCSIVPLLKSLMDRYGEGDRLSISFPSTRVDALTPEVLEQVQRVRRTGFTVAPEGGTQRLRDVINKGVSDEQILETCGNVFRMGWNGIKLYFMLGLPTETDEDLQGIIDIAKRVRALPEARGKDITVSVSTHVPKPHTPFQWAEQITPEETIRRQRFLADGLRRARVNFRYHDPASSFLEGVFCRGGRELAPVIVRAYQLGSRLDAWQEHMSQEVWNQAFADLGVNPYQYLAARAVDQALPWDHLSCGISKDYFALEYKRALRFRPTPDCLTKSCSVCGACDYDVRRNVLWPRNEAEAQLVSLPQETKSLHQEIITNASQPPVQRLRLNYAKHGLYEYLGHLELSSVIQRATRRAEIPLCYTLGYHPLPRIAFGPPLQLGVASKEELVDLFLHTKCTAEELVDKLNAVLPEGLRVLRAQEVAINERSLSESISGMRFEVTWIGAPGGVFAESQLSKGATNGGLADPEEEKLRAAIAVQQVTRVGKGKRGKQAATQVFTLGDYLEGLEFSPGNFSFSLKLDHRRAGPKASEVVKVLSGLDLGDYYLEKVATQI